MNRGVLQRVVEAAELSPSDCVVEVGPGMGILTRELVQRAKAVIAIELDKELVARLERELGAEPSRPTGRAGLCLVHGDILAFPPEQLSTCFRRMTSPEASAPVSYKVVANLPYYITAPVLRHFLTASHPPTRMVVMVQYEVAKSIVAKPGEMGLLAIAVQFYGQPDLVATVSPGSFSPPPKVRSAILKIDTYSQPPVGVPSHEAFFDAVKAGFSARRKQLHNALAHAWRIRPEKASTLLMAAAVDPRRRAQSLNLEEWARIAWARQRCPSGGSRHGESLSEGRQEVTQRSPRGDSVDRLCRPTLSTESLRRPMDTGHA